MKLWEFIRERDDSVPMSILLKDGRVILASFLGLFEEEYYSFLVEVLPGGSPDFPVGAHLEVIGVRVQSINGQEFDPDPEDPGPGSDDM